MEPRQAARFAFLQEPSAPHHAKSNGENSNGQTVVNGASINTLSPSIAIETNTKKGENPVIGSTIDLVVKAAAPIPSADASQAAVEI
jgi:hypothetical protein